MCVMQQQGAVPVGGGLRGYMCRSWRDCGIFFKVSECKRKWFSRCDSVAISISLSPGTYCL